MNTNSFVWVGLVGGSTIGGIISSLLGSDAFSISSILWSGFGALLGIYVGFKLSQW